MTDDSFCEMLTDRDDFVTNDRIQNKMELTNTKPILFLCGGLQSSGSTLISWCFLQRPDMNGYFDANNDILNSISKEIGQPFVWYKTTISCFRLSELMAYYRDAGWDVRPVLVIRDMRLVWNSLVKKKYGRNGTTAEDPPLRMRFRRIKEDWELFRKQGWSIIRLESFLENPEQTLRQACENLQLPWDAAMATWPKHPSQIADMRHGSRTFKVNREKGLASLKPAKVKTELENVLPGDLAWLENEFAEFNKINAYPEHIPTSKHAEADACLPTQFDVTRRQEWYLRRKPVRWLMASILMKLKFART